MITAGAIKVILMQKKTNKQHESLDSQGILLNQRTQTSQRFSGNPTLMLAPICQLVKVIIFILFIASVPSARSSTEQAFR